MNTRATGITGGQVFAVIATFFAITIAVNATMAVLAMRSWSGLVVANGYVASQGFNKELAEARHQAQLGWRESFGYLGGKLTLTLSDAQLRPIEKAQVIVRLERPSTDREDKDLVLREIAPGKYELTEVLSPGLWDADAIARIAAGATLRRLYRFHVTERAAK